MKWIGFLLTAAACAGVGQWAASQIHRRVHLLECSISLVEILKSQLSFTMAEPAVILREIEEKKALKDLSFLAVCLHLCKQGTAFPVAWRESLETDGLDPLTVEDRQILTDLGNVLGSTGLQGQIDQLNLLQSRLKSQLEAASQRYATNGKLYRSLGLMGGLLLVILLW